MAWRWALPCGAVEVQRLKTRAQFQAVMAGSTVSRTAHFALHRLPLATPSLATPSLVNTGPGSEGPPALFVVQGDAHGAWMGALVPKRWAKRAVTRNLIKRQVYNVSQALTPPLPSAAHVVRLRTAFDRKQFVSAASEALKQAVRAELQDLFARVQP